MHRPPASPKIFHITHVDNLANIVAQSALLSHSSMIAGGDPTLSIGMNAIKEQRLALPVTCHQGDSVGDYVPFYFCPRSIMLYLIFRDNHPELTYHGGQDPIVHLEADLREIVEWADRARRKWAFSLSNAGAAYAQFRSDIRNLGELNWPAIESRDFREPDVKEGKQAEFLVYGCLPWELISRIGVRTSGLRNRVTEVLEAVTHRPDIVVKPEWYY
jgi:hypothetical protein